MLVYERCTVRVTTSVDTDKAVKPYPTRKTCDYGLLEVRLFAS